MYTLSETVSKCSDVIPTRTASVGWPCAIACSRFRRTTPILLVSASEEEVGDEDEDEHGTWLVSTHYTRAAPYVPRTYVLPALTSSIFSSPCLSFTYGAR